MGVNSMRKRVDRGGEPGMRWDNDAWQASCSNTIIY